MTKLVTIATYFDPYEACVVQSYLTAHGVPAILPEWYHATAAWHHVHALQGVRLWVYEPDEVRAREILSATTAHNSAATSEQPLPDSSQSLAKRAFSVLLWWYSGIPTPYWRRKRHWASP